MRTLFVLITMLLTIVGTVGLGIGSGYLFITLFLRSFGRARRADAGPPTMRIEVPVAGD